MFKPIFLTTFIGGIILTSMPVNASTRINFAQGSYCGSYSGHFNKPLVLNLDRDQTLTIYNQGRGDLSITINGAFNDSYYLESRQEKTLFIPIKGDYYFSVLSTQNRNTGSIEFCAY